MKFEKYDSYINSEIDWLEDIPSEWSVKRIKDLSRLESGSTLTSNDLDENSIYPAYGGGGFRGYTSSYTNDGDHLLIGRQGALCGNIKRATGKFWATEHSVVVYHKKNTNIEWYKYILDIMNLNQYSISSAQPGLSVERLTRLSLPYIDYKRQEIVANYLDIKTLKIDREISILEQKIEKYKELKQTLIAETVLRGLDKNAPLHECDSQWIGDIPKHWDTDRLKNIFNERVGKNLNIKTGEPVTSNILSVMKDIGVINHRDKGNVGNKMAEDITNYKLVYPNDIVVNKMNVMIGSVGISKEFGALSVVYIILITKKDSYAKYYDYFFRMKAFQRSLRRIATGILEIREAVNMTLFMQEMMTKPPYDEQVKIANYLDEKTSKIDSIVEVIGKKIEVLKEFRKTLINDVVTGKVKVA